MSKTAKFDDYEPVADRLARFWVEHPNGQVVTQLNSETTDVVSDTHSVSRKLNAWVAYVELFDDTDRLIATGHARQELLTEPPTTQAGKPNVYAPEWTSPVEVAETSAIGRALANAGYAAKRPSREEMSTKKRNDAPAKRGSVLSAHDKAWRAVYDSVGADGAAAYFEAALKSYGLTPGEQKLDDQQADELIAAL
jgi:hypothetical protein